MERDVRRDRGQWRGCYEFKNIICDGDQPATARRNGGLKMGQPYYYYYELDGSVEAHDPSKPTTSTCPYLPGQTVNMMHVPAEVSTRKRSGSLSSVRNEDFKTMDPNQKFTTPRPAPAVPDTLRTHQRAVTSQTPDRDLKHKRCDRSVSPTPSSSGWWSPRKLFTRKNSVSSSDRPSSRTSVVARSSSDEQRRSTVSSSSEGSRARPMSPESLRKFLLSDDVPSTSAPVDDAERLFLSIPDDIVEEDDDNFATSAVSENGIKTFLSPPPPPPSQPASRHNTPNALRLMPQNESVVTLKADKPSTAIPRLQPAPLITDQTTPTSRFSFSSDEGSVFEDDDDETEDSTTDSSSHDVDAEPEIPSFYHSEAEDDDRDSDILSPPAGHQNPQHGKAGLAMGRESLEASLAEAFRGYRLPLTSVVDDGKGGRLGAAGSPPLAPREAAPLSILSSPPLLAAPSSSVVDDFVSEMSGCIQGKWN